MAIISKECRECGKRFEARNVAQHFCGTDCRKGFNNRRAVRGAELYDFLMSDRFQRKEAEGEARSIMNALASGYRESDRRDRDGRQSWNPFREAKEALARLPGVADGR